MNYDIKDWGLIADIINEWYGINLTTIYETRREYLKLNKTAKNMIKEILL